MIFLYWFVKGNQTLGDNYRTDIQNRSSIQELRDTRKSKHIFVVIGIASAVLFLSFGMLGFIKILSISYYDVLSVVLCVVAISFATISGFRLLTIVQSKLFRLLEGYELFPEDQTVEKVHDSFTQH